MKLDHLKYPLCIAHRGVKACYPENTLIAFHAAIESNAQMIEFDVALSRDRHPVIIHDETLNRTTNATGAVASKTLRELKQMDAGSWFDQAFKSQRVPTLSEAISLIASTAVMNIELKKEYFEDLQPADAIENQVLQLVTEHQLRDSALISSFEIRYLQRLRHADPTLPLAFISLDPLGDSTFQTCRELNLFSLHLWHETITPDQIHRAKQTGWKVFVFTVNDENEMFHWLQAGVDGVFTDNQPAMEEHLRSL